MAVKREWRAFPDDSCWYCGATGEVYANVKDLKGRFTDGDKVRCVECGCPGAIMVDEDDVYIRWHDEPDCDCEWCKAHPVAKWDDSLNDGKGGWR